MEKGSLNTVRAYAFCISSSAIKTRVHFFPSAGITTGPYSISCMLTLFGKGIERKSVMLDGGRLGQPDGVRLEDAFAALRTDVAGTFGLEIQLSCPQPRVNLLSSQAAIELTSSQFTVMYGVEPFSSIPVANGDDEDAPLPPKKRTRGGVGLHDSTFVSSLVVVNSTTQQVKPEVFRRHDGAVVSLPAGTIASESAVEVALDEVLFKESSAKECSWGLVRSEPLYVPPEVSGSGVAYYLLYRDAATKRPVSVCSL